MPGGHLATAMRVIRAVEGFMLECARLEPCRRAGATLRLEAWATVGYPGEPVETGSQAGIALEPGLDGEELARVLEWVQGRARVSLVMGEGDRVLLRLEADENIAGALEAVEDIARSIASRVGPGLSVEVRGRLGDDGVAWSLYFEECTYDHSPCLEAAARSGARAALRLARAVGSFLDSVDLDSIAVEASAREGLLCASIGVTLKPGEPA